MNCDAVIRTLVARGLITEAGTDADSGATTFSTTEMFLERLGSASLGELPDIAPLLPDVDVIDDLSETLDSEPRFARLSATPQALGQAGHLQRRHRCVTPMSDAEGTRLQKVLSQVAGMLPAGGREDDPRRSHRGGRPHRHRVGHPGGSGHR